MRGSRHTGHAAVGRAGCGRYAGAVGWLDAAGNGQFAVSIRGASIDGAVARVVAGNGLVGDSDPPTELIETRAKLQAMLGAIVRP